MVQKQLKKSNEMKNQVNEINSVKKSDFTVILCGCDSDEEQILNDEPIIDVVSLIGAVYYKDTFVDDIEWKLGDDNFPQLMGINPDSPYIEDVGELAEVNEEEFEEGDQNLAEEEEQLMDRYMLKVLMSIYGPDDQEHLNPDTLSENFENLYCVLLSEEDHPHLLFGKDKQKLSADASEYQSKNSNSI